MTDYQPVYSNSIALLIGINSYTDPRFVPLGAAEEDAKRLAHTLAYPPYSFQTRLILGSDATKSAILDALFDLQPTQPDDRVIIYFAGHGYTLSDNFGHETGYLAAADTLAERHYTALELDEVTALRRHAGAKHISFIFDACFSGQALGLTRAPAIAAASFMQRSAYQVVSAGAGDQTVGDFRSMTDLLVDMLESDLTRHGTLFTLSQLGLYLQQTMASDSKQQQIPQFGHLQGSQGGDLVFYASPDRGPVALLPLRLRSDLLDDNPRLRYRAVGDLESLLTDPEHSENARLVLEDMLVDDPDPDVRRKVREVLRRHRAEAADATGSESAEAELSTAAGRTGFGTVRMWLGIGLLVSIAIIVTVIIATKAPAQEQPTVLPTSEVSVEDTPRPTGVEDTPPSTMSAQTPASLPDLLDSETIGPIILSQEDLTVGQATDLVLERGTGVASIVCTLIEVSSSETINLGLPVSVVQNENTVQDTYTFTPSTAGSYRVNCSGVATTAFGQRAVDTGSLFLTVVEEELPFNPFATQTVEAAMAPFGSGGGRIAFDSDRDGDCEIYILSLSLTTVTPLTQNETCDFAPTWSADGTRIAFISARDGNFNIYIMNADGSNQIPMTHTVGSNLYPDWSPDGAQIAYSSDRGGNSEIYVTDLRNLAEFPLTENPADDQLPAWSPDGQHIAFASDRSGDFDIYVMDVDGSNVRQLTSSAENDTAPAWSPDGTQIAFYSRRDGNAEIYIMDADGSNQTRVTTEDEEDLYPAWSPDGRWLVFTSYRDGNAELYAAYLAFLPDQRRLTTNGADDLWPSWAP